MTDIQKTKNDPENGGDKSSKNTLYCSFCGKSQHEIRKLIAGPTVFICDECVELCLDIIRKEDKSSLAVNSDDVAKAWEDWRQETPSHELLRHRIFLMAISLRQNRTEIKGQAAAFRILLAGAKGSGLADAIYDIWQACGLPIVRFDGALLRNTHLVKSSDMFARLLQQADYNGELASAGAILIENIDRIFGNNLECTRCQEELELLMRGVQVPIELEDEDVTHPQRRGSKTKVQLDTSGISFIALTNRLHPDVDAIVEDGVEPGLLFDGSEKKIRENLVGNLALKSLIDQFDEVREFLPFTGEEIEAWLSTPAARRLLSSLNLPNDSLDSDVRTKLVGLSRARDAGFEGLKSILRLASLRQSFASPDGNDDDEPEVFDAVWLERRF